MDKPVQESTVIIGNMTVGGTISTVEEFANILQVCVDADPIDAVCKALGVS